MLAPGSLFARDNFDASPQGCQPLSFSSSVCVGDFIAIIACSIAGLGFIVWSIHAIRKIRNDPLDDLEKEAPNNEVGPSAVDHSVLVQHGVAQAPSYPDRVHTRLALSQPEEKFYSLNPDSVEAYTGQTPVNTPDMPRRPAPVEGPSKSAHSRRSGRHMSLVRGGSYDNGMYNDSPPQARDSQPHGSGGSRAHRSMRGVDGDPMMYHPY